MITSPTIWGMLKDELQNNIIRLTSSGAPTSGTSGTGAGFAGIGSTYFDTATGNIYRNTNTIASPTWVLVTSGATALLLESMITGAATIGLNVTRTAKAQYDFTVDGGAVSTITFASNATIPINAIIMGGIIDVLIAGTTGASGTMSLGTSAGSSTTSLKAALAAASYTGLVAVVPVFTAATMVKLTAAGAITGSIATGALTAGKWNVILNYVVGN